MARLKGDTFVNLVAHDLGKTNKVVKEYVQAIINRMFKEIIRGNSISIDRFGTFKPTMIGGYYETKTGDIKYSEPKVDVEFSLSDAGIQLLNNKIFTPMSKKRVKEKRMFGYEKELMNISTSKKRDLEEVFFEIMDGRKDD